MKKSFAKATTIFSEKGILANMEIIQHEERKKFQTSV